MKIFPLRFLSVFDRAKILLDLVSETQTVARKESEFVNSKIGRELGDVTKSCKGVLNPLCGDKFIRK